jgi:hypothetical protein
MALACQELVILSAAKDPLLQRTPRVERRSMKIAAVSTSPLPHPKLSTDF